VPRPSTSKYSATVVARSTAGACQRNAGRKISRRGCSTRSIDRGQDAGHADTRQNADHYGCDEDLEQRVAARRPDGRPRTPGGASATTPARLH
jgi:hypothetical protein